MEKSHLVSLLEQACALREPMFDPEHQAALRLFNGFLEGFPQLVIDLYATSLVLFNHGSLAEQDMPTIGQACTFFQQRYPWLTCGILKTRNGSPAEKRGVLLFGQNPADKVRENGVWYALDIKMNQDASFYLDTRNLRQWLRQNMSGMSVLNTFAYTGSLGVSALAGGASRVIQLDLNRQFLEIARRSYALNGFAVEGGDLLAADFWQQVGRFKREKAAFDCVLVDAPFFARTNRVDLDLNKDSGRLVNKVRPLVKDGGWLVSINNALYVSGREYLQSLEALCTDGYLTIDDILPVPADISGFSQRIGSPAIADPAPFNHSTKIVLLKVVKKKEKSAD